ncbi:MAG: ATP-dependent zinc metalloprotease FtsH [Finegoldia sp.]|nr:ATP-dependent zinc metalloprotease FtsH [Finegoldia sp.]
MNNNQDQNNNNSFNNNNKNPKGKKNLGIYYVIAIILYALVAGLIFPNLNKTTEKEVTYDQFVQMVEQGKVSEVNVLDDRVDFKVSGDKDTTYKAGLVKNDFKFVERLLANKVKFSSEIPNKYMPILSFILQLIIPFVIIFGFMELLMRQAGKKMGGTSLKFGKSNAKIYVESQEGKKFTDVAGQEEAKESLQEVVEFLHDPSKYTEIGAKMPKGILLVGPPGTGKTLLAQAVAGEAQVPFFSMSGSEFVEMFVGLGASKVRDLFKQASEKAPCIVFIDEIDAIGKRRDTAGVSGNDEREQTLNQLLSEMDGFSGNSGVIILAATNRPEILDPALTRPGRFDRQIPVELPDLNGRIEILKVHAKNVKVEEDINYRNVALMTAGTSGAELANIVNEAALRAVRMGRKKVSEEDLIESVEVVIAGQKRKGSVITPKEKKLIAYHEVGHALVAAMQTQSAPVTKITIIPRTSGALGYTMQVDEDEKYLMDREELFNNIVTLTGGRAAEEVAFGKRTTGASNDIEKITKIARAMVAQYGMTDEFDMMKLEENNSRYLGGGSSVIVSDSKARQIDDKVQAIVIEAHKKAKKILEDNIDKLHEIAEYLLEKETITGKEFMDILALDKDKEDLEKESDSDSFEDYKNLHEQNKERQEEIKQKEADDLDREVKKRLEEKNDQGQEDQNSFDSSNYDKDNEGEGDSENSQDSFDQDLGL